MSDAGQDISLPQRPGPVKRMLVALAMPLVACAIQWLFWDKFRPFIWFLFYPSVFLSAWISGLAGALSAAALAAVLAVYCFVPPALTFSKENWNCLPSVLVFLVMAAVFGRFHDRLERSERARLALLEAARQRDKRTLESQEALLARMSRVAKVGGWEFDAMTGEGTWTEEVANIHDLDPSIPPKVTLGMDHYTAPSQLLMAQAMHDAVEGGRPFDLSLEIVSAKGFPKWVRTQGFPVVEGSRVVRVMGALQDISAQKTVEAELRSSEELFAMAFSENPAAIALTRLEDGLVLDVNATWETLTGHRKDEVLGRSVRATNVWPTELEAQRFVRQIKEKGVIRGWEQAFRKKTGETFVTDLAAQLITLKGEAYVLSTLVDITSRKRAEAESQANEAKLQAALASMTDAVLISDQQGRLLDFNDAFATFHRFGTKEECARTFAEHREILDVRLPNGDLASMEQQAVSRALRGEAATNAEYSLRRKDTGESWVGSYSFAPIRDKDHLIVGSVVVARDVTEQKQIQDEIRRLNTSLERRVEERTAELTAANAELEAFAYAVSHDLRAPLRAMSGFSQALAEDFGAGLPAQATMYLDQIAVGSERMGALIDGLLTLSRSTQGSLQREPVDLSQLAQDVQRELERAEPHRQVTWHIESGLSARGDTRMLLVVLRNLLGNAWKYTARQAESVISFDRVQCEGAWHFRVTDNGAGFDLSYAAKLFQPFQRLHRQDEFPGLGIGLATVQRIVRRHGGEISAQSKPGMGATFQFTLASPHLEARAT